MTYCCLPLSLAVTAVYPMVMDEVCEDGLNDGGVEVHHHCLWQVEFLELPQEVHPLCFVT